jgi:pyruvate,orthophosphate dikinase
MPGLPVTVRLLDPPLHEFLPQSGTPLDRLCEQLAGELGVAAATVRQRLAALREANPMMGLRGCRLGIIHHDITAMQVRS